MNKKNKPASSNIIDAMIDKMFFDLDTEIEISQWWIYLGEKRYSRSEIIIWLYEQTLDMKEVLLHMHIFVSDPIGDEFFDALLLRMAKVFVSQELIEDIQPVQDIVSSLERKYMPLHPDVQDQVSRVRNIFSRLIKK